MLPPVSGLKHKVMARSQWVSKQVVMELMQPWLTDIEFISIFVGGIFLGGHPIVR